MDMGDTIIPKSDQLNAEELKISGPRTFTITEVKISDAEQPVWIYLAEHPQPWKPAKTVRKLLVLGWGPDQTKYVGRRVTLFCDDTIKWAGKPVGGIRMSHMSHIKKPVRAQLAETRQKPMPHVVEPLSEVAPDVAPTPPSEGRFDAMVRAFNEARIAGDERINYCRGVIQRDDIGTAADMTDAELAKVVEALQGTINYERESETRD